MTHNFGSTCKVAVIGAGGMANEHLKAFSDVPGVVLTGIYSRTRKKAALLAEKYKIPNIADSVDDLFYSSKADLVVVTVNAPYVGETVMKCAQHPWTILAEKPVGINCKESETVLDETERLRAKVYVALNRRFYSSTLAMTNDLADNPGQRMIEVFDQQEPELFKRLNKADIEIENLMYVNSIHTIDYFSMIGRGEITQVNPIFKWNRSAPLAVTAGITFSSGDIGVYHAIWDAPAPWYITVTTTTKRWELRPLENASYQLRGTRCQEKIEPNLLDTHFKPGLRLQAEEAVKAALGLQSKSVSLRDAHKTMRLISQLYDNASE